LQLQTNAATDTHNICHAGQYVHTVQHGNVSSHTWTTAIQGALGLLNAAKVPGFYTGTHFILPTPEGWPGWVGLGGWLKPRGWERGSNPSHPSTNRARCRLTTLIVTNALPLHQTATISHWSAIKNMGSVLEHSWKRDTLSRQQQPEILLK